MERALHSRTASGTPAAARTAWCLAGLLVVAAACAAYAPIFSARLVNFDDDRNFVLNPHFRALDARALGWMFSTSWMGHFQPLSWLSLALDFVASGDLGDFARAAPRMHQTNVALHALNALLVMALTARLWRRLELPRAFGAALATALLFALHPLRVESVAWVTERRDVLSAVFFLGALAVYVDLGGRRERDAVEAWRRLGWGAVAAALALGCAWFAVDLGRVDRLRLGSNAAWALPGAVVLWCASTVASAASIGSRRQSGSRRQTGSRRGGARFVLCAALTLLSLSSKAWGVVLPALFVLLDLVLEPPARGRKVAARVAARVLEKAPLIALSVGFLRLAAWAQAGQQGTLKTLAEHGALERVLQACYGLVYYPLKLLWPVGLAPIHELPDEIGLGDARFAAALAAVAALVAVGPWLARQSAPALAALVAYALIVSPVLGLFQSGPQLVAERYAYLSTLPLILVVVGVVCARRVAGAIVGPAAMGVCVMLGVWTWRQARTWRDPLSLWQHAVKVEPESATAQLSLGSALEVSARELPAAEREQRLAAAVTHFERAIELAQDPRAYSGLAAVAAQRAIGDPQQAERHHQDAVEWSRQAIQAAPEEDQVLPELYLNYGVHLLQAGERERAWEQVERFVRLRPDSVVGRKTAAAMALEADRAEQALAHCLAWRQLAPRDAAAARLHARALQRLGRGAQARQAAAKALELDPQDPASRALWTELGGDG